MSLPFIFGVGKTLNVALSSGRTHVVPKDHPNYDALLKATLDGDEVKFLQSVDVPKAVVQKSGGSVQVVDGNVLYKGNVLHHVVVDKILAFMNEGLPFNPMVLFLENLLQNPSYNSREQLYPFLERHGLAITEDGCFLAHKAIGDDYLDKHSRTISNRVGEVVKVDRASVSDNINVGCGAGLHCGTFDYSRNYGSSLTDRFILVKVNPKDVVSVPNDSNFSKCRVCEYLVVKEISRDDVLKNSLYNNQADPYIVNNEFLDDFDTELDDDYDDDDYEDTPLEDDCDEDTYNRGYDDGYHDGLDEMKDEVLKEFKQKRDARGRFTK